MTGRRAIHGASHDTSSLPRSSGVNAPSAAAVLSLVGLVCVPQGVGSADRDRDAEREPEQGADTRGAVRAPDGGEDGGARLACLVDSLGARRHGYASHVPVSYTHLRAHET